MTIIDDYLDYQVKYEKEYGENTCILMQVGHFFECYAVDNQKEKINNENIYRLSDIMNIQLTRKNKTIQENHRGNPLMIGVNLYSIDKYIQILLNSNYTIILIEQVSDPPEPDRKVTAIYSPGTDLKYITKGDTNNLVSLYIETVKDIKNMKDVMYIGLSSIDLSTGKSTIYEVYSKITDLNYALDETYRFIQIWNPKELIVYLNNVHVTQSYLSSYLELSNRVVHFKDTIESKYLNINFQKVGFEKIFPNHGIISVLEYLDLEKKPYGSISFTLLLEFAHKHNEKILYKIDKPEIWDEQKYLILTNNTVNQLNVIAHTSSINNNCKFNSLFSVINKTSTSLGKRYLLNTLLNPIINQEQLNKRYSYIEKIIEIGYNELEYALNKIMDIERLHRKISLTILQPSDFIGLDISYSNILTIIEICINYNFTELIPITDNLLKFKEFIREYKEIFNLDEISKYHLDKINNSFFNKGIDNDIDNIQSTIDTNYELLNLHATKLAHLLEPHSNFVRLEYNERDGHYLSITSKRLELLKKKIKYTKNLPIKLNETISINPNDLEYKYINRTSSRITSNYIKQLSGEIRYKQHTVGELCRKLYIEKLEYFDNKYITDLKSISEFIAKIDTYKSIAKCAITYNYTRPIIDTCENSSFIDAVELRHPIIERLENNIEYVPNDITIGADLKGILLYGTNASGKSSLMKAVGLNIIMAQAGFFVSAKKFTYKPYNYLFTRINNNDNIFKGESSFAVEMLELRNILKRSNSNSLILGDELCSGTESISALSIFAASVKYLSKINSSFIFATHLHELTKMEQVSKLSNVGMFHLKVIYDKETKELIYNRKLEKGSGDAIYGLEVCKAMDMDYDFLKDANEIRQTILNVKRSFNEGKLSNYNSNMYMDLCQICNNDAIDTHHIKFQCEANQNGIIGNIQKDTKSNLVALCKDCHNKVHDNIIIINGYIQTSNGIKLDYKIIESKEKLKKRKYDANQLKIINSCIINFSKLNLKILANKIEQDYNIKISSATLSKIKKGTYL